MKVRLFFIVSILLPVIAFTQSATVDFDIEIHIENILLSKGKESDNQSYYELLVHFFNNPININSCNSSDLHALGLIDNSQIKEIIDYRDENELFSSKYELLALKSFSLQEIRKIIPFLSFTKPINLANVLKNTITSKNKYILISRSHAIEPSYGFLYNKFLGTPPQYNLRIKIINPGHTSLGINMQKDPGEILFRVDSLYKGPDFYSFHYYIQNQKNVRQLALGDYKLQFGQGLLLGAGFLVGKNANSITPIQATLKVQPYTSLTEYSFFRGLGTTLRLWPKWELSLFYSSKYRDAHIATSDSVKNSVISLSTASFHRTPSELKFKNSVREQVVGSAIIYTNNLIELGILGLYNNFSIPFNSTVNLVNIYKFKGKKNYNISLFYRYHYKNITLYGEVAHTLNNGSATNLGLIASLSKNINFSFQYRSIDPNFHSFYGVSFTENSTLSNERGAYWGMDIHLSPSLRLVGYFDMYKFPWLKSTMPQPTTGNDGLIRLNYKLKKIALFYAQIQTEKKSKKMEGEVIKKSKVHTLIKLVLNLDYNLDKNINFRTRLQWTESHFQKNEIGVLLFQDITIKNRKITLTGRYAIFDTEGFLPRQYMYEKGVLYSFSIPQFSGKGIRYYLMVKYSLLKTLVLRAKWSQTIYYDRRFISSGLSKIEGNKKSQFILQLKYDF